MDSAVTNTSDTPDSSSNDAPDALSNNTPTDTPPRVADSTNSTLSKDSHVIDIIKAEKRSPSASAMTKKLNEYTVYFVQYKGGLTYTSYRRFNEFDFLRNHLIKTYSDQIDQQPEFPERKFLKSTNSDTVKTRLSLFKTWIRWAFDNFGTDKLVKEFLTGGSMKGSQVKSLPGRFFAATKRSLSKVAAASPPGDNDEDSQDDEESGKFTGSVPLLSDEDFKTLLKEVEADSFSKLDIILTSAHENSFTMAQLGALIGLFNFSNDQIKLIKSLDLRVINPKDNQDIVLEKFDFETSKQEAKEALDALQDPKSVPPPDPTSIGYSSNPVSFTSSPKSIEKLLSDIKGKTFSKDKIQVLSEFVKAEPGAFNGDVVVAILSEFEFENDKISVLNQLDDFIVGLSCKQVIEILNVFKFSKPKLTVLEILKNFILDSRHKFTILGAFSFSSDKLAARKILASVKPRSPVFGSVNDTDVVFVIDTSGSMDCRFEIAGTNAQMNRLEFVKRDLMHILQNSLTPQQTFAIVRYSTGASCWKDEIVPATPENIDSATKWVNSLSVNGGTNMIRAVDFIFEKYPLMKSVYFLTDGVPNSGPSAVLKVVEAKNSSLPQKVKIHTIAFLVGNISGDNKPVSKSFMRDLALGNNGSYRALE